MELRLYLGILYRRLWIVILIPVIVSLAAAYYNFYKVSPVYMADTSLYVGRSADDTLSVSYSELMMGSYLVEDYRQIIKSRAVTSLVIDGLKLKDMTPDSLAGKITVSANGQSRIIQISVYDVDPKRVRDIANKVAEAFILEVVDIMKLENVCVIDKAQIPAYPIKSNPIGNIAISFFIGLIVAIGVAILLEYINDKIKTQEDVEKYLGVTVLGTIPEFSIK